MGNRPNDCAYVGTSLLTHATNSTTQGSSDVAHADLKFQIGFGLDGNFNIFQCSKHSILTPGKQLQPPFPRKGQMNEVLLYSKYSLAIVPQSQMRSSLE